MSTARRTRDRWLAAAACLVLAGPALPDAARAQTASGRTVTGPDFTTPTLITLGTNSGPIPNAQRAEPANLLRAGDQAVLIDAGDGAAWQLGKAGVPLSEVRTVIISHLHFDHTGGLFAFLSQRYQVQEASPVTLYGPPGLQGLVDGLIAAMDASTQGANNMNFASARPADNLRVVELTGDAVFTVGTIRVTAARNSHFSVTPGGDDPRALSLAFRFDTQGRSIVYTGDTGPSPEIEHLAAGADLLVSEIMDPEISLAILRAKNPGAPAPLVAMVSQHFHRQHLSPEEVGLMASRARVKALVLTHNALPDAEIEAAGRKIAEHYHGPITFARDLDSF